MLCAVVIVSLGKMTESCLLKFVKVKHPESGETCLYNSSFQQKDLDSALSYKAKPTDLFVCSYPKTGTTWLQNIVWLIVRGGQSIPTKLRESMPMLEFDGANFTDSIDDSVYPRIIKTHFKQSWVPHHPQAKYLYITRNPKDVVVSYFYHIRGFECYYHCPDLKFDDIFDIFVKGEVGCGSLFSHVTDWYKVRENPNVLFLVYEDVKKDPREVVLQIARFLGKKYEDALHADDGKILEEVLEKSSFKSMSQEQGRWVKAHRDDDKPFVRKGIVGDWKNHLSKEQDEIINKLIKEKGGESGWSSLWDEHENVW